MMMVPIAVLDILADDWMRSRRESARRYGTRPSRIITWYETLRGRGAHAAAASTNAAATPAAASGNAA